nr:energy transducer TonB [uncultured Psychroserpens sp.]
MKDFKKSHNIAGQSNEVQKSHKHDVNLQKNSSLYFQIGLILCLLGTYAMFEMKFEDKVFEPKEYTTLAPDDNTYQMVNVIVEDDAPKQEPVKKQKKKIITDKIKVVENNVPTEIMDLITKPASTSEILNPNTFEKIEEPVIIEKPLDLTKVEIVPIYPGCERKKTNKDRIKCMNEKIGKLVQRRFDTDLASKLGLSGKQRITVQFKINQKGEITDIKTRAPHPRLEKEAERVTNKIPQMKPGLQREKPVSVLYNLPIVFNVNH